MERRRQASTEVVGRIVQVPGREALEPGNGVQERARDGPVMLVKRGI